MVGHYPPKATTRTLKSRFLAKHRPHWSVLLFVCGNFELKGFGQEHFCRRRSKIPPSLNFDGPCHVVAKLRRGEDGKEGIFDLD